MSRSTRRCVRLEERRSVHDVVGQLPEIAVLREHSRSLAVLEALLSPEWENRYHSFDNHWSETESMASMRNGSATSARSSSHLSAPTSGDSTMNRP